MAGYVTPPVDVDPAAKEEIGFSALEALVPGFNRANPGLAGWLIKVFAQIAASNDETASETLTSDFRWLGENLADVPAIFATQATGTVTITGDDGEVVPAGTHMYAIVGDQRVGFTNDTAATLTGGTAAGVPITADDPGAVGSEISGTLALQDLLVFVDTVTLDAPTTGGVDAEDPDVFLDRLRGRLSLRTETPIKPAQFAQLAKDIPGVWRSIGIDGYDPADNEIQSITVNATGGTFPITFDGQTVTLVDWNATAAAVKTKLESLSNVDVGDIVTSGGPLATAPVLVEFKGQYTNTDVPLMTSTSSGLTGGTHTASFATTRAVELEYDPDDPDTWALGVVATANVDTDGEAVTGSVRTAVDVLFNGNGTTIEPIRERGFKAPVIDPTYTTIGCAFTFVARTGFDPVAVKAAAEDAVSAALSPSAWGGISGDERTWENERIVYAGRIYEVLYTVDGMQAVTSLTLSGGTASGADRLLPGVAPLTRAGSIVGTPA